MTRPSALKNNLSQQVSLFLLSILIYYICLYADLLHYLSAFFQEKQAAFLIGVQQFPNRCLKKSTEKSSFSSKFTGKNAVVLLEIHSYMDLYKHPLKDVSYERISGIFRADFSVPSQAKNL